MIVRVSKWLRRLLKFVLNAWKYITNIGHLGVIARQGLLPCDIDLQEVPHANSCIILIRGCPRGGFNLLTLLYVLAGWFAFNILFAIAMYFRPVRQPDPVSIDNPAKSHVADPSDTGSIRPLQFNAAGGFGHSTVSRVLFFGHWLSGRVR